MFSAIIQAALIGGGLAMDAFSVSITDGIIIGRAKLSQSFKIAIFFGLFQFIMPIIGYIAGSTFSGIIESFDHWVAFALLVFIGGKMAYEALFSRDEEQTASDPLAIKTLLVLAVATSIDALAVGITFATISAPVLLSSAIIGIVTFIISAIGVMLGSKLGSAAGNRAQVIGGVILIAIGAKILIEHLFF